MQDRPWWWLDEAERAELGLGSGVARSAQGVVFGDEGRPLRLEILARTHDAPVRLGPIALRVWGDSGVSATRTLLRGAVDRLGPRLADDFDPAAVAIEARSPGATAPTPSRLTLIDVPSTCDRACAFCHVSRRPIHERHPRGSDADVERAIETAAGRVLFTGDDALSHPRIVEWVALASARTPEVAIIGPPRLGATAALAPALARAGLRKYATALLGASEGAHDRLAGREGAHRALVEAADAMQRAGIVVELVTPLVRPLLGELGAIVDRGAELARGGHALLAYAPDSDVGEAFDAMVPGFDELRAALLTIERTRASIDSLPLCVLPESRRPQAGPVLDRSDPQLRVVHPEPICGACELRPRCPGIAATVERAVGTRGLVPLRRA